MDFGDQKSARDWHRCFEGCFGEVGDIGGRAIQADRVLTSIRYIRRQEEVYRIYQLSSQKHQDGGQSANKNLVPNYQVKGVPDLTIKSLPTC